MRRSETDEVVDTYPKCHCIRASAKALLVTIPALGGDFWIPRRVVHDDSEVWEQDHVGSLVVAGWFGIRLVEERNSRRKAS